MVRRFYKWYKKNVNPKSTVVEVTNNYFAEGDEYINARNGYEMLPNDYIEIKDNKKKENEDVKISR